MWPVRKNRKLLLENVLNNQVMPITFGVPVKNRYNLAYLLVWRLLVHDHVDHASQQLDDAPRKVRSASHQLQGRGHPTISQRDGSEEGHTPLSVALRGT